MATTIPGVSGAAFSSLSVRELAALLNAPKKGAGTQVTVKSYPVKLGPAPLLGAEHMYTEYDDGQSQYIFRGGPSRHGLHAQVDPAGESPDYGRGTRVVHETFIPGRSANEAAESARGTAARIEGSGRLYKGLISNSNSAVGDQMRDQFGYRVGAGLRTPGAGSAVTIPQRRHQTARR